MPKVLLQHNAKVYLAARSQSKASAALEELEKETGKTAIFLKLDLSDLTTIRTAADEFMQCALRSSMRTPGDVLRLYLSKEPLLHVLYNSA